MEHEALAGQAVDNQGAAPAAADGPPSPVRVDPPAQQWIAEEVIELGEALFDAVVAAAIARPTAEGGQAESFPEDDIRAAAAEFFAALRVLLNGEQPHAVEELGRHGAP